RRTRSSEETLTQRSFLIGPARHSYSISSISLGPKNTWFPSITLDLQDLELKTSSYNPASSLLKEQWFYVCPGHKIGNRAWRHMCGGTDYYFCAAWACVSTGDIWWPAPVKDDLITVRRADSRPGDYLRTDSPWKKCCDRNKKCNPIVITFTEKGKSDSRWEAGNTWGLRMYTTNQRGLPGALFTIRIIVRPISTISVGPNLIVNRPVKLPTQTSRQHPSTSATHAPIPEREPQTITNPLWNLLTATYKTLNLTNPNVTNAYWLCYDIKPPFYEAIGLAAPFNLSDNETPAACKWDRKGPGLTFQVVTGTGTCIGNFPRDQSQICTPANQTIPQTKWIIPPPNGWWICSKMGLTPCVNWNIFNATTEYCIMVLVLPRVIYREKDDIYNIYELWTGGTSITKTKQEPFTAITLATLFGLGVIGAGTGISSLAIQHQGFTNLRAAIDKDIARIEESITHLEKSLTSLSEVVLQNRRRLDLLFLQQGGLCAALKEECCFYADHTGVVQDSMAKVREGLAKREREREQQQGWLESWFTQSPWLTTLLSAAAGPLLLLLLLLTLGPIIFVFFNPPLFPCLKFVKLNRRAFLTNICSALFNFLFIEVGICFLP
uniref:Envelope protein n=1 Tax=Suricata suricatta TaxID=37032 RepID=A0A673UPY1_SURSU